MMRATSRPAAYAVVLVLLVLAGALLTAGPASAASRGYKLYNHSARTLRVESASPLPSELCIKLPVFGTSCTPGPPYPIDFEGRPRDGQLFPPNFPPHDWELKYGFNTTYGALLRYKILGTDGFVEYAIATWAFVGVTESRCEVVPSSVGHCTAEGLKLTFQNPA